MYFVCLRLFVCVCFGWSLVFKKTASIPQFVASMSICETLINIYKQQNILYYLKLSLLINLIETAVTVSRVSVEL
jgi:hypothetical protein